MARAAGRTSAASKRRSTKPRSRGRRLLKWLGLGSASLFLVGLIAFLIAWFTIQIPSPNELATAEASILYYADGKTEIQRLSTINRESIPLSQIPAQVQHAMIAAEDRDFYSNSGVSPAGIARAIKSGVSGGQRVGGSTITQQYVKNYYLTQEQTISRKFSEIILSLKIDGQLSKDEILANYLNTIYYGRGAYGIQTAAKSYFGKGAQNLTVAEGALLASVIRGPSLYDPSISAKTLANAKERFGYVLDGMVEQGWLTPAERATTVFPTVLKPASRAAVGGPQGYIVAAARQELAALGYDEDQISGGGLRIVTTIDKRTEDAAITAMTKNLPTGKDAVGLNAGLVAIKPGDGAILALYGGKDFAANQFSAATDAHLQAGSTFKPFCLLAAVSKGISTNTRFNGNSPVAFPEIPEHPIPNFGDRSYGMVTMRRATARSINTAYVGLNLQIGPEATKAAAIAAGIPADTPGLDATPTNVLGTASPRVIDIADAYATIAAQGTYAKPYLLKSVTSSVNPDVDYTATPQTRAAFGKDVTADVTEAMTQTVLPGGTATKLQGLDRPVAGKTGTSNENKSVWFAGFVPQMSIAVGMYKDVGGVAMPLQDIAGYESLTGGTFPTSIWYDFADVAFEGMPVKEFPARVGIGDDQVGGQASVDTATATPSSTTTTSASPTVTTPPSTRTPTTSPSPATATPGTATTTPQITTPQITTPQVTTPTGKVTTSATAPPAGTTP